MTQTPTQTPLDEEGLEAATEWMYPGESRSISRERAASAIRAYIASQEAAAPSAWSVRDNPEESDVDGLGPAFDVLLPNGEWRTCIAVDPTDARDTIRLDWEAEQAKAATYIPPVGYASPAVAPVAVSVKPLRCLLWVYDRLSLDGGMTAKEQLKTFVEIGKTLRGEPAQPDNWTPNEWDDSFKFWPLSSIIPATKPAVDAGALLQELAHDPRILIMGSDPRAALDAALSAGTATPKPEVEK